MNIEVNYVAIFLAAIVSMIAGFIWYSPSVLGKPWMKASGHTPDSLKKAQKEMGKLYGLSFLVALLTAYVLFHVMGLSYNFYHYSMISTGIISGFWMWIGFVMPVQLTDAIFGKKNWKLFGISTGYQLVSLVLMGVVIGLL